MIRLFFVISSAGLGRMSGDFTIKINFSGQTPVIKTFLF
jgi:hypothetical protein